MTEMEILQTTTDPIEMDMGDPVIEYSPVYPNPEGEPTDDLTKVTIQGNIYQIKDPEVHEWARAENKPTYTKAEVGLGNVNNTSDLDKPISTATQTALDGKVDDSELGNYYTKSEVNSALDNKADKSDTYSKTETDNLLSAKADSSSVYTKTETDTALGNKVDKVSGKGLSTNDYDDTAKGIVDGVTSALADKVDKVEGYGLSENDYTDEEKAKVGEIDNKLDKTETAVNANGLALVTPVTDTAPYIYRQTPVKESFKALMKKIVGASVVWNQLIQNGDFASTNGWGSVRGTMSVSNNILSYTSTEIGGGSIQNRIWQNVNTISGHKYLATCECKPAHSTRFTIDIRGVIEEIQYVDIADKWQKVYFIMTTSSNNTQIAFALAETSSNGYEIGDVDYYKNTYLTDLTAMFGTTIADYVYTLETSQSGSGIAWLQSYGFFTEDYYAYKQNKLESGCVSAHKTYDGETLLTNTELSPITLRGLFKLSTDKLTVDGDEYKADGSVTRKYNDVILDGSSDESWQQGYYGYGQRFLCIIDGAKANGNLFINGFKSTSTQGAGNTRLVQDGTKVKLDLYYAQNTFADLEAFKTYIATNNLFVTFELATPTTEQTTPFTETEIVGSTEEFIDYEVAQGNRDVAIPVGTETDYYQEMKLPSLPTTSGNHNLIYNPSTGFGWS